jgi:hypothetical protein
MFLAGFNYRHIGAEGRLLKLRSSLHCCGVRSIEDLNLISPPIS